ncbi:MAG: hypothetical protein AAF617_05415, partial [Bacteroidota bacterium]
WDIISGDLTTNDPEKLKQAESGGLTMDATGAENHCTILVIEPSPLERNMLWAATDDGRVHITRNGGQEWTEVTKNIKGLPAGSWIVQVKASNKRQGEALLVANDYRRFNYEPYAYRTTDYGKTWERIVDASDVESYTLSIVEDPENRNLLFLGTDDGLYISLDAGTKWQKWTAGFPTVSTKDLVIQPREQDLVIGTFGRAAWVLDDIRPLRAIASDQSILSRNIALFEPPTAYQAAYQQPSGSRFGADAMYHGENKRGGAMISYYFNKKEMPKPAKKDKKEAKDEAVKEEKKVKWDSIKLEVFNNGKLIRTLKNKAPKENGIHRMYWRMDEKGSDRPSRTIRKRRREPGGMDVKPGIYELKITYGDQTSQTSIKVASDPRLKVSQKNIDETYAAGKKLSDMSQTAADAVKQLVESKNAATTYQKTLSKLDKKKHKDAIKASKDIIKRIDEVIALYLGKVDKRQGITRNPEVTVMQRMGTAGWYVGSRQTGLTDTERQLMQQAEDALKDALDQTNTFFTDEWNAYRTNMEQIDIKPFKETTSFQLND